jgi:ATP phosphoribosyltransferase
LINIAIPKGRLQNKIKKYFQKFDITIEEQSRKLDYLDTKNNLRFLFVKNADVPVYVNYGAAALGITGSDVIFESNFDFLKLMTFPFGSTRICIAGYEKDKNLYLKAGEDNKIISDIKIATKFTQFTKQYFYTKNMPVQIIKLSGSVELAPILGLSHFIVDLVETGTTLKENHLSVIDQIGSTQVELIANPGLYKLNYQKIDKLINTLS